MIKSSYLFSSLHFSPFFFPFFSLPHFLLPQFAVYIVMCTAGYVISFILKHMPTVLIPLSSFQFSFLFPCLFFSPFFSFLCLHCCVLQGYDISFLITNFNTEVMLRHKLVDFVIHFMEVNYTNNQRLITTFTTGNNYCYLVEGVKTPTYLCVK